MAKKSQSQQSARRAFVKKAAYMTPAILSLAAAAGYATVGSAKPMPVSGPPPSKGKT